MEATKEGEGWLAHSNKDSLLLALKLGLFVWILWPFWSYPNAELYRLMRG